MGIWKQRIDQSWLKSTTFRIVNAIGGTLDPSKNAIALSLKHYEIDRKNNNVNSIVPLVNIPLSDIQGYMIAGVGENSILEQGVYSYIIDYYFGPSITDTKEFNFRKNYQFKTHVFNFAYAANRTGDLEYLNTIQNKQPNAKLYNSSLNIFKGALGIDTTWGDPYVFDVPYYKAFDRTDPKQPSMHILYFYSSPNSNANSGLVSFTNTLKPSKELDGTKYKMDKITASQSVYAAGYGIGGIEINEIGWKLQGYSFASYDNDPGIGDYSANNIYNYYSGPIESEKLSKKKPIKQCVFAKGWYYDDLNNEYTWYDQEFDLADLELNSQNNPVGGETGNQDSDEGYRTNNYIAKYIPFQKFNLSFLYENLRTDSGIKVYLSRNLPNSRPEDKSKYFHSLRFPAAYSLISGTGSSLVNTSKQTIEGGLPLSDGKYYTLASLANLYAKTTEGGFSKYQYAQERSGRPQTTINIPLVNIQIGSVVSFNFMNEKGNDGDEIKFVKSYVTDFAYASFYLLFNAIIATKGFKSTSHRDITWDITCDNSNNLKIVGIKQGTNSFWSESYSRLYVTVSIDIPNEASRSTIIMDYSGNDPNKALVNNIYVSDASDNLEEIKIKLKLRHTSISDLIINLRAPNGNVINLKAKGSGEYFNDLRNITFSTRTDLPMMKNLFFWPKEENKGYIEDPIGITTTATGSKIRIIDIDNKGNLEELGKTLVPPGTIVDLGENTIICNDKSNSAIYVRIKPVQGYENVEYKLHRYLSVFETGKYKAPKVWTTVSAKGDREIYFETKDDLNKHSFYVEVGTDFEFDCEIKIKYDNKTLSAPLKRQQVLLNTTQAGSIVYPVNAPWLQAPYKDDENFDWPSLRIRPDLTFQMDKANVQGGIANLKGFNNILKNNLAEEIDFSSNINNLSYMLNEDGTFNGTYSLYIKDDSNGNSGLLEYWDIEFIYEKLKNPILSLTQSDVKNEINPGNPKYQYLFGLEGNQYLIIVGDRLEKKIDSNAFITTTTGTASLSYLKASLSNLKIDGGYHIGNNKMYQIDDVTFGTNSTPEFLGNNTFKLVDSIENISYTAYVGYGNLNDDNQTEVGTVVGKIGNGKFISGIWENGAWNSGWRKDDNLQEFYSIADFFSYNRDKRWRFVIEGSMDSASKFEIGDRISIGNIVAIDVNEERKLIRNYFTIMGKTLNSIEVEFESDFPIRRIKIDSELHRIYVTKNVWLTGGFFNGYFSGVWNNGLFKGFPYLTEMFDSHWLDGIFDGGHFKASKKELSFKKPTYVAKTDRFKMAISFETPHKLTIGDQISIYPDIGESLKTSVASVIDDYDIITDINWDNSKIIKGGRIATDISTGLVQNIDFNANNVSKVTSLQSMDSTQVFMYDSWMDVNFDETSAVNIGKPQSTIENSISKYSYSDNNLYGYPSHDILSSNVTFRDSFSNTVRNYRLGSKYKIYEDYIGNAGNFDEYFDITGWATKARSYKTSTAPFTQTLQVGDALPTSTEFLNQGWSINKDSATYSAISFERTTEALDDQDPSAGKEMKVNAIGKGGVLNIQPSYDVVNRTNSPIEKQRYTVISFDMIQSINPDFIFQDDNTTLYDFSTKYQPLIHFNNLNYALRRSYISGVGYRERKLDSTYLPIYKNVNHVLTENKSKIEYFYNKTNLSMFFRGNGLNGKNISTFILDNLKLYEVDMIPFFQYFTTENISRSISIPYQAIAPNVEYVENEHSLLDNSIYGLDSFYIYQPSNISKTIEPENVYDIFTVEDMLTSSAILWSFNTNDATSSMTMLMDNTIIQKVEAKESGEIVSVSGSKLKAIILADSSKTRQLSIERRSKTIEPYVWKQVKENSIIGVNAGVLTVEVDYDSTYQYRIVAIAIPVS